MGVSVFNVTKKDREPHLSGDRSTSLSIEERLLDDDFHSNSHDLVDYRIDINEALVKDTPELMFFFRYLSSRGSLDSQIGWTRIHRARKWIRGRRGVLLFS